MKGGYAVWMGHPVVLRVVAGNLRVPLRGRMLSETDDIVRLRIADSWDIDIFKSMVVCVEHDNPIYVVNEEGERMSALAGNRWEVRRAAIGTAAPLSKDSASPLMNRMNAVRDTLLVL